MLSARLNGRDTDKPDAWSRPVPPHRYRFVDQFCPEFQPSSDATPFGDFKGNHEGRAPDRGTESLVPPGVG